MQEKSSGMNHLVKMLAICFVVMIVAFYLVTQTESRILSLAFFAICPLMHIFFMRDHHKH